MAVRIKRNVSRLAHATLLQAEGIEFWGRPEIPDLLPGSGDTYYTVEDGDRIDVLARRFYRDEEKWWVIAHANDMTSPTFDLVPGQRIRIPDPAQVRRYLLK